MAIIGSILNNLAIEGVFELTDLRRAMAALHRMKGQGYDKVNLDMSKLTYAMPTTMLPLATYCRSIGRTGFRASLELPEDAKLARLFENSNWAHLIDETSFEISSTEIRNHVPAIVYTNAEQHYSAVDRILNFMLAHVKMNDPRQLQSIEWALNEITDNVLNHAESNIGGVVQANFLERRNEVEFIVCDAGLGIPRTLRSGNVKLNSESDSTCLDLAIREGVTKNSTTNQGNGLYGAYRLAQLSNGRFTIHSGFSSLVFDEKSGMSIRKQEVPYSGSVIVCAIRLDDPNLLAEALTFKGRQYTPGYTIVDKMSESESVIVDLSIECKSFGSRAGAAPIRQKIENILSTTSTLVQVKLDDVALITSSFADEVFGKTFVKLGPLGFNNRIKIIGANKIVSQLIDRAIMQRMNARSPDMD